MEKKYVLALDQGTTSSRAIVFNKQGEIMGSVQQEFPQIYPHTGWVEHDPIEILGSQVGVISEALIRAKTTAKEIAAIGITNQRETTIIWDRKTGAPVYNAIVWQCRRTAPYCDELKEKGIGLVAIYDAGVKSEAGYFFYDELIKNKYVLTLDGETYTNEVWPGESIFPNYFDVKCRDYITKEAMAFEEKYGIDGIWCDMNEPASFRGPLPMEVEAKCDDEIIYHEEFHNMYGEYMARSISESFTKRNLRPYVITRAAFATSSQFTTAWNGDNQSLWGHLEASLPQVATMNICNFPLDGVDVGGFGNDCTKELLIRWIEANIFSPFLRNHSSINTRMQEPWMFDQETIDIYRKMLSLRYELIPYLYDLAYQSHMEGTPIIRPLFVNFKDDINVKQINDEIMIGDSLLLAPILHQGETKRSVYVPEGRWYDYFTHEVIEGGKYILADIPLDSVYLLVKEGSIIPKFKNLTHLNRKEIKEIIFDCSYGDGKYINYEDDGETLNYLSGQINVYQVEVKNSQVSVQLIKNGYDSNYQHIYVDNGVEVIDLRDQICDK